MTELWYQVSFMLVGAALMLALLGLIISAIMPGLDLWSKRFFLVFFTILVFYAGIALAEVILYIHPAGDTLLAIVFYSETLIASVLLPLMTILLLHVCGEDWKHSPLFRAVAVIWAVSFVTFNLTLSPLRPLFYSMTLENDVLRGPLYDLSIAPLTAMQILNLAGLMKRQNQFSRRAYYAFLVGLLPIAIALIIHFFVSVFELIAISIVICALSMYGLLLSDQIAQFMRQQREIADQRASIAVLQMRPHFIYNAMMSIYYLCKQNPDLAQQVTLNFTTYLRKNFTAIASDKPIPFFEELEHTRAYLAVEQAQFEDSLFVDYNTPYIDFLVPPLTLQPIVENAVKHGMDQDSEPLHILIRTNRTAAASEIIVENNGADYDPLSSSGPHIALQNIQQRLQMMCRGRMVITPREGGGTVVKLTIPETTSTTNEEAI